MTATTPLFVPRAVALDPAQGKLCITQFGDSADFHFSVRLSCVLGGVFENREQLAEFKSWFAKQESREVSGTIHDGDHLALSYEHSDVNPLLENLDEATQQLLAQMRKEAFLQYAHLNPGPHQKEHYESVVECRATLREVQSFLGAVLTSANLQVPWQ